MSKIVIGKTGNNDVSIDLDVLIRTRLLIQANSGGGKSWLLRLIAEQLFGKIPIHIVDPEGEFASLREKFPFVLIGEGGEAAADVRSAHLVAERLLEHRASAVIDLYEAFRSKPGDRRQWVRRYLDALIDAPKKFWRQETPKAGSQAEREIIMGCKDAMIALTSVGRKRRFCAIWATQRLAKVDKDASAELLNRLIGLTFEDVDIERAADLLSIPREEKREFKSQIRVIEPGNWFAIGRAISKERLLFHSGSVQTKHPDVDTKEWNAGPPPTPEKIKHLLPKLSDLPQEAEQKAQTEAELRGKIRQLERDVAAAKRAQPKAAAPPAAVDSRAIERAVRLARADMDRFAKELEAGHRETARRIGRVSFAMRDASEELNAIVGKLAALTAPTVVAHKIPSGEIHEGRQLSKTHKLPSAGAQHQDARQPTQTHPRSDDSLNVDLSRSKRGILEALAQFEAIGASTVSPSMIAGWRGVKASTGSFGQDLRDLRRTGHIAGDDSIALTDEGRAAAPPIERPASTSELLDRASRAFGVSAGKILRTAHAAFPAWIAMQEIADQMGVKASTGSFGQYVRDLARANLLERKGDNVKAADWLFLEQSA